MILKCLRRLMEDPEPANGINVLIDLRRYPALLFFYVACLSAIAGDKYALIAKIFNEQVRLGRYKESGQLISLFHQYKVLGSDAQKILPGREREFTPLNNHLFEYLRTFCREYISSDLVYENTFDWFEYLVGLLHYHHTEDWPEYYKAKAAGEADRRRGWGPLGCFAWRHRGDSEWILRELELKDGVLPDRLGKARDAFLPGNNPGTLSTFLLAKEAFDNFVVSVASRWY